MRQRFVEFDTAESHACATSEDELTLRRCGQLEDYLANKTASIYLDVKAINGPGGAVYDGAISVDGVPLAAAMVESGEYRPDQTQYPPTELVELESVARCNFRGMWARLKYDSIAVAKCEIEDRERSAEQALDSQDDADEVDTILESLF
ncbi:hypothetical protein A3709_20010 [Halioglobus sp. HI00S01]|uniref:hypothetical protein n=1 Tax=Halioglobus sp. HI00S01 TaxID=1822214 RepID=UPI0007C2ECA4|nr:hypothetical protein [Halioglobus sp. HI00S01]KZX57911.1 hypothetical protein A3709_20010 [Halioglobus sp. HI00S01]